MRPIEFKGHNAVLTAPPNMPTVKPLPLLRVKGMCISCWRLSFVERVQVLLTGRIWLSLNSGWTQPPALLTSRAPFWIGKKFPHLKKGINEIT